MFWLLLAILVVLVAIFFLLDFHLGRIRRNQRRWLPRPGTTIKEDEW